MATKKKAAAKKPAPKAARRAGKKITYEVIEHDEVMDDDIEETEGATIKSKDGKTVPCAADESKKE